MEEKAKDVHLRAMLNSPVFATPAIPVSSVPTSPGAGSSDIPQSYVSVAPSPQSGLLQPQISRAIVSAPPLNITPSEPTITIQNCVTTVDLHTRLDLAKINARTRNSEYNPSRFHGLIMRLREPRTTALIFQTGKIVCTGAKSEQHALLASKKFARIIQKLGFNIKFDNFKVQNLVATCDLKFPIKLESFSESFCQFCSYEPELFPGVIHRNPKPRLCHLIFVNGKIVFTGSKSRQDIYDSLNNIYPKLLLFKKKC